MPVPAFCMSSFNCVYQRVPECALFAWPETGKFIQECILPNAQCVMSRRSKNWISVIFDFDFAPGSEMRLSRTSRIFGTRCRRTHLRAWSARGAKPAGRCGPCATWAMPRCRIRARFSTALRPGMVNQAEFSLTKQPTSDVGKSSFSGLAAIRLLAGGGLCCWFVPSVW